MSANQNYIDAARAAADLIAGGSTAAARIIIASYLAVPQHIEAALADYAQTDPRLDLFRKRGPNSLLLIDGQLEDTAAAELITAATFLEEMNYS